MIQILSKILQPHEDFGGSAGHLWIKLSLWQIYFSCLLKECRPAQSTFLLGCASDAMESAVELMPPLNPLADFLVEVTPSRILLSVASGK